MLKKRKRILFFVSSLALFLYLYFPTISLAQIDVKTNFNNALKGGGLLQEGNTVPSPEAAVGKIINAVLTYVGVVVMIFIIYAGGLWVTARGEDSKIKSAKSILTGSIIGLLIVFSAAIISNFIISRLGVALVG